MRGLCSDFKERASQESEELTAQRKIAIVGGCGHVGLPLGVSLAKVGTRITLLDINPEAIERVKNGRFPFLEKDGDVHLSEALANGMKVTDEPEALRGCDTVIFVVGTPVDEHLNPRISDLLDTVKTYGPYLSKNTLIIMRSTLYPGTMDYLQRYLKEQDLDFQLAFCPERVAQGFALEEIQDLPQIVSAFADSAFERAASLFSSIAPSLVRLAPMEAEMAKLMTNSWRYVEFAIANQFYIMAEKAGIDFHRVYGAIRYNYPRAKGFKAPGFTAGPCLFKDTMQLSSFFDHQFNLGHAAMLVNEGLASFVVQMAENRLTGSLQGKKIGLLGMTFKANSDDTRESLSFRVKKLLVFNGAEVKCHDPYLADSASIDDILQCDCIILTTPHNEYRDLNFKQPLIDVWGYYRECDLEIIASTNREYSEGRENPTRTQ